MNTHHLSPRPSLSKTFRGLYRLLLVLAVLLPLTALWAAPVDKDQAMAKARQFYSNRGKASVSGRLKQVARATGVSVAMENDCFYVFSAGAGNGFVIISGDDRTEPVLGYADDGTFSADDMPVNMKVWLDEYVRQIQFLQQQPASSEARVAKISIHPEVTPLMTTKWDQGYPYNKFCPVFFDEAKYGRSVTGCGATAMAQVMKYHQHPAKTTKTIPGYTCATDHSEFLGTSSPATISVSSLPVTSLDWGNMLDKYVGTETQTQENAVARLMQACGSSVHMEYATAEVGGSGSYSRDIMKALTNYMDYDKSMQFISRISYSAADWDAVIYEEMMASRPVLYFGQSTNGGHAFVIDGYDGNGYYHVNWGWSGMHNGYFLLDVLTPGDDTGIGAGEGGYNYGQDALIGIKPNAGGEESDNNIVAICQIEFLNNYARTRTSTDDYFKNVRVKAGFYNTNEYHNQFDLGIGTYDTNGNLLDVVICKKDVVFAQNQIVEIDATIKLGAGYPTGMFRMVPVCKTSAASTWKPAVNGESYYVLAIIDGYSLSLDYSFYKLQADLALTNSPEVNGPADLRLTVKNNGMDFISPFTISTTDDTEKMLYGGTLELKEGETRTYNIPVVLDKVGKTEVGLFFNGISNPMAVVSINTVEAKPQKLTCTYNVTNANSGIINDNKMAVTLLYSNAGQNNYDNIVNVALYKKSETEENQYEFCTSKTDRITLAKGASTSRGYVFTDLESGDYFMAMSYMTSGQAEYASSSYLYTLNYTPPAVKEAYAVVNGSTLTFYYDSNKSSRQGTKYTLNEESNYPEWAKDSLSIKQARFDSSFKDYRPTTTARWFKHNVNLTSIQGMSYLNTSATTNMAAMFYECYTLPSVDVSGFDTRNVTNMQWMFFRCRAMKNIDLSSFNTSKVTTMGSLFYECESLTSQDLSNFNTSNVNDIGWIFAGCESLQSVNISSFNTDNVKAMNSLFVNCAKLTTLDLSHFKTDKVTDMNRMFYGCTALTKLNVSSFNTAQVTDMEAMFYNCESLATLDVSSFNTPKTTNMSFMFRGCSSLKELNLTGFDTSNVETMQAMMYGCSALTTIYAAESWNTEKTTKSGVMFGNCYSLVGGKGTTFDSGHIDKTYARLDEGTSKPGYFTLKGTSIKGDVNGDNEVNVADIGAIIDMMAIGGYSSASDVNSDGIVNVADVGQVIDIMAGKVIVTGYATIILTAGDMWGDGSGYQMLIDAEASAYGTLFPVEGPLSQEGAVGDAIYAQFEYKIPENADGDTATKNIVLNSSASIKIPAGIYDWCITNPTPGDRVWIASDNGTVAGRFDNYMFEAGKTYTFTIKRYDAADGVDLTITDIGSVRVP